MSEIRKNAVTLRGNPLTLVGPELKAGDKAPDFSVNKNLNETLSLEDLGDGIKIFNVIISVDTPVCDKQTRKFNEEAANLGDGVEIVTFSADLPFALNRYCGAAGIDKVITVSDYKNHSFAEAYGVLIDEFKLLSRAIFVVDKDNVIRHAEYVSEVSEEPDYEIALEAVNSLL
ncbi:MAG: thiol peroxidase [Candidatus Dadabacteria bacterium]|nr:thiol peroxidase [Candidatus Dadabacteria bacterium]